MSSTKEGLAGRARENLYDLNYKNPPRPADRKGGVGRVTKPCQHFFHVKFRLPARVVPVCTNPYGAFFSYTLYG